MSYGHFFEELNNDDLGRQAYKKIEPDFINYITSSRAKNPNGFKNEELAKEFIENVKLISKASFLLNEKNLSLPKLDWDTSKWLIAIVNEYDTNLGDFFEKIQKV